MSYMLSQANHPIALVLSILTDEYQESPGPSTGGQLIQESVES